MTSPGEDAWEAVEALFHEALQKPVPRRTAFVRAKEGVADAVRQEVLELLEAHEAAEGRFDTPGPEEVERWAGSDPTSEDGDAPVDLVGTVLGDCVLTRRIASGGMGVVYEAVQTPPGRKVAVKLMRASFATPGLKARFEHEVRLLGGLQHPGICAIYGAGTHTLETGEALPYFVMEYLPDAEPLASRVQRGEREIAPTLRTFLRVCEAVHHGHLRGVIHRDLKPDNILVDVDGNPKVIDFGIARATDSGAEAQTALTQTGQILGTLNYMSPEQLLGKDGDLDLRSDVYALGVMLYELLTGKLPQATRGLGIVEVAKAIREVPPTPPSSHRAELGGDLQIILLKCLAKEREARYDDVEDLRADLERYLAGEPIHARPTSAVYRLRLFVRKNKALSTALAGIFVASLVGTVVSIAYARHARQAQFRAEEAREDATREAERAERARDEAERETARAKRERARADELLQASAEFVPWATKTLDEELQHIRGSLKARQVLAEGVRTHVAKLEVRDGDSPLVRRAVAQALMGLARIEGGAGSNVGERGKALVHIDQALDHYRSLQDTSSDDATLGVEMGLAYRTKGHVLGAGGETDEARAALREGRRLVESYVLRFPAAVDLRAMVADIASTHADAHWTAEEFEAALDGYMDTLSLYAALEGEVEPERLAVSMSQTHRDIGDCHEALGDATKAAVSFARSVELLDGVPEDARGPRFFILRWDPLKDEADRAFGAKDYAKALAVWQQAVTLTEAWVLSDAADRKARDAQTVALGGVALSLLRLQRLPEAHDALQAVATRRATEILADPTNMLLRHDAVVSLAELAGLGGQLGRLDAATEALARAKGHLGVLLAHKPKDPAYLRLSAQVAAAEGQVVIGTTNRVEIDTFEEMRAEYAKAGEAFRRAHGILAGLHERGELPPAYHGNLESYAGLVTVVEEAIGKIDKLIAEQEPAPDDDK